MTLGEVRSQLTGLLNRRDCTTALADTFLRMGMARLQRQVRVPSMERSHYIVGNPTAVESFGVPVDLLQIMDVFVDGKPLSKVSFRELMNMRSLNGAVTGPSEFYARIGAVLWVFPAMPPNTEMVLTYYGEFEELPDDTSENTATEGLPDVLTYSALTFAGDYFKHDSAKAWEARYVSLVTETMDAASQLEMTGGPSSVTPPHADF